MFLLPKDSNRFPYKVTCGMSGLKVAKKWVLRPAIYWPYTVWRKKNACFSNKCNFVYFQYKKIMVTPKQPVINAVLITYIDYSITEKLYRKDGVLLAVHTSGASPQSSASHLLTLLVAQLQFLREWKLSDRRMYEVFERRLLIWGNPKERNRRQINLVSVGAKGHAFFLRHSV